jgi:ribosomal RNA-processing protein 8
MRRKEAGRKNSSSSTTTTSDDGGGSDEKRTSNAVGFVLDGGIADTTTKGPMTPVSSFGGTKKRQRMEGKEEDRKSQSFSAASRSNPAALDIGRGESRRKGGKEEEEEEEEEKERRMAQDEPTSAISPSKFGATPAAHDLVHGNSRRKEERRLAQVAARPSKVGSRIADEDLPDERSSIALDRRVMTKIDEPNNGPNGKVVSKSPSSGRNSIGVEMTSQCARPSKRCDDDENARDSTSKSSDKKNVADSHRGHIPDVDRTTSARIDDEVNGSPKKKSKKKKKKKKEGEGASTPIMTAAAAGSRESHHPPPPKNSNIVARANRTAEAKDDGPRVKISIPKPSQMSTLQRDFLERLTSSRFRELNEELYTHTSRLSFERFTEEPELFDQYHVGFRKQAESWPLNPVDVIYKKIVAGWTRDRQKEGGDVVGRRGKEKTVIADFGCGDAKLAERLLALRMGRDGKSLAQASAKTTSKGDTCPFEIFSFDLVSGGNPLVTPADMSDVPLPDEGVDVAVYSLALMGTNVADFVREAWRVLRFNGVLRIAEVRSRFETASGCGPDEEDGMITGKRAKSNNGKRHHPAKAGGSHIRASRRDAPDDEPKPLMLLDEFISLMERCGFQCTYMDRSNKMFLFMDFVKLNGSTGLSEKERFTAKACIYKKR